MKNNPLLKKEEDFVKLWIHEIQRVFLDRLINEEDINIFNELFSDAMKDKFSKYIKYIIPQSEE